MGLLNFPRNIYKRTVDILWGFENISLPWEYLPKDYKHLIRLENYSCALGNTCGSGPLRCMAVTSLNLLLYFKNNAYCTIHNINTFKGLGIFIALF